MASDLIEDEEEDEGAQEEEGGGGGGEGEGGGRKVRWRRFNTGSANQPMMVGAERKKKGRNKLRM